MRELTKSLSMRMWAFLQPMRDTSSIVCWGVNASMANESKWKETPNEGKWTSMVISHALTSCEKEQREFEERLRLRKPRALGQHRRHTQMHPQEANPRAKIRSEGEEGAGESLLLRESAMPQKAARTSILTRDTSAAG